MAESETETRVMLWDVENNANCDRYCIHPAKSHILRYCCGRKKKPDLDIFLSGDRVDITDSAVHLGIVRNTSSKVDIEGKITLGRKTASSLMGAGFHGGGGGLKPSQNGHIWTTFVIPRLLYGLDTLLMKNKDIQTLEKFQKKCLKQIQGLPDNASNSACLVLLGVLPTGAVLHKNLLTLFVSMIRDKTSIEYEIAQRQLVMREDPRDSMFTYIKSILEYYDLPSVFWLLNNPPTKAEWKRTLNHKINDMVESEWQTDIESKSSTKYVNPSILKVGTCRHIWSTVRDNIHDSKRAQLKCKLLTGTYILQSNRAVFNQYSVNSTCKLCELAPETRQHFIGECVYFETERSAYINKLTSSGILTLEQLQQLQNPDFLTCVTLDASCVIDYSNLDLEKLGSLELYTREYINRIHIRRVVALKQIAENT